MFYTSHNAGMDTNFTLYLPQDAQHYLFQCIATQTRCLKFIKKKIRLEGRKCIFARNRVTQDLCYNGIRTLHNLSVTNKFLYTTIQNRVFMEKLMKFLSEYHELPPLRTAHLMRTHHLRPFLQEQLDQYHQAIRDNDEPTVNHLLRSQIHRLFFVDDEGKKQNASTYLGFLDNHTIYSNHPTDLSLAARLGKGQ